MKISIFQFFCSNCCLPWQCIWSQRASPSTSHSWQKHMVSLLTCYYGQSCTFCLFFIYIAKGMQEGILQIPKIIPVSKTSNLFYTIFFFPHLSPIFFPSIFLLKMCLSLSLLCIFCLLVCWGFWGFFVCFWGFFLPYWR